MSQRRSRKRSKYCRSRSRSRSRTKRSRSRSRRRSGTKRSRSRTKRSRNRSRSQPKRVGSRSKDRAERPRSRSRSRASRKSHRSRNSRSSSSRSRKEAKRPRHRNSHSSRISRQQAEGADQGSSEKGKSKASKKRNRPRAVKTPVVALKKDFVTCMERWTSKCITPGQSRKIRVTPKALTDLFVTVASEVVKDIQQGSHDQKVTCVNNQAKMLASYMLGNFNGEDVNLNVDKLATLDSIAGSITLVGLVRQFRKAQTITNEADSDSSFARRLELFKRSSPPVFDPLDELKDDGSFHHPPSSLLLWSAPSLHSCPLASSGCLPIFTSTQFNPQRGREEYWIQPRGCREGSAEGSGGGGGGSSEDVSGGGSDPASGPGVRFPSFL
jgi:hypothetical protein